MKTNNQAFAPPEKTFASAVLLWFREDMRREDVRAHWRGSHAHYVAHQKSIRDYRQHHFDEDNPGLWPSIDGVETTIPAERRVDGMPESLLNGLTGPLRGGKEKALVYADEVNAFKRTVLYIGLPNAGRRYRLQARGRVGSRCVVLLRRRPEITRAEFALFVDETLAPALAVVPSVRELTTQVFAPWSNLWDTPGVAHDNAERDQFHSTLVLGFADQASRGDFFASAVLDGLAPDIARLCVAVHAYSVEATYHNLVDGRVMLPQVGPVARPSIDPVTRVMPPAPPATSFIGTPRPIVSARIHQLGGFGPEDVVADAAGNFIVAMDGGRVARIDPGTGVERTLGDTGGRPLGLEVLPDGGILICDARRGLLRLDPSTSVVTTLVSHVDDIPLRFCSNVTASADGTLWFTESTTRFDFEDHEGSFIEHRGSGRLIRRDPDGRCEVIFDGLQFANGVTLTDDESALIFVETSGYSLKRLWLKGPLAGRCDVIADNLPGFPDNMSRCRDGRFWVAMVRTRNTALDRMGTMPALARKAVWEAMPRKTKGDVTLTWAMEFDVDGNILTNLRAPRPDFGGATGVAEAGGKLALVSPHSGNLLLVDLPERSA